MPPLFDDVEQRHEVEQALSVAVNYLLGTEALDELGPAKRLSFLATSLLALLGDCPPPATPPGKPWDPTTGNGIGKARSVASALQSSIRLACTEANKTKGRNRSDPIRLIVDELTSAAVSERALEKAAEAERVAALKSKSISESASELLDDLLASSISDFAQVVAAESLTLRAEEEEFGGAYNEQSTVQQERELTDSMVQELLRAAMRAEQSKQNMMHLVQLAATEAPLR